MISSQALGKALPPVEETVDTRRLLAFAAGIGDTRAAVFDDAGDLTAAESFCVSLEWPVISHPEVRNLLGATGEELLRGVHVVQDSTFHGPVRPGAALVSRGRIVGLQPTRAGTLLSLQVDTAEAGRTLVTSWIQTLFRGVPLEGEGGEVEPLPPVPEPEGAETAAPIPVPVARELPHLYTECARIWNPIHTERQVACAVGLPDRILHGTATWALAGRELRHVHGGEENRPLRRLRGSFRAMVIPGTDIEVCHAHCGGDAEVRVWFSVRNANGEEAIAGGYAEF